MPRTGGSPGCTKLPVTTSPVTSHHSKAPSNSFPSQSLGHPTPKVPGVLSQHGCMGCGVRRALSFHLCYCFGQCWQVLSSPLATPQWDEPPQSCTPLGTPRDSPSPEPNPTSRPPCGCSGSSVSPLLWAAFPSQPQMHFVVVTVVSPLLAPI